MPAHHVLNILCIEDNPGEARLIERNLTRAGHIVTWVRKGAEGLSRQAKEPYDVVLIDYQLPDMKGLYVLQKLLETNHNLPAVLVTAHGDEETAVSAMKLGAKDYIIKDSNGGFTELLPAVVEQVYNQYAILLDKQKAEKATQNREAILTVVAQAAEQLLKTPQWEGNIGESLEQLGRAAHVSRVYLVENLSKNGENPEMVITSEWVDPIIEPFNSSNPGKTLDFASWNQSIELLKAGRPAFGRIEEKSSQSQRISEILWPHSFVLMPIFTDFNWWGFIGLDDVNIDRVWERVEIEALGTAANILGAALQRQQTEATLYQAQKLESIGLLAGGIAHDFNNLLTSILTQTSLSLYKIPANSDARKHIGMAIQASEQAADLVRQLLGYAGQGKYQIQPIDLNELIEENSGLFHTISRSKARFQLNLLPGLPAIEGDRSQIQQIVMNLVINATEAVEETGGLVLISTSVIECQKPIMTIGEIKLQPGSYICLRVKDTGNGMKPETITHIFDPFFTTKSNGRGLGLSATLGIVKAHGGGLQVESNWEHGSIFEVFLPVSKKNVKTKTSSSQFGGRLDATIMIIDDEKSILEPVKDSLEMAGARVLLAENGRRAIDIYRQYQHSIDLVILDMIMPDMDGRETFLHLQKINPDIKVVLSSGFSEMETVRLFKEDEVILFLKKPFRFEKLIDNIKMALK